MRLSLAIRLAAALLTVSLVSACASTRPSGLGVNDGQLAPCPSEPRCVSSQAPIPDTRHNIADFIIIAKPDEAWTKLNEIVAAMPRTQIIESQADYLYAEVTTPIMRFVDDLEFYYDRADNTIQVRSSARIGYFDGGLNRNRVERIRRELHKAGVVR